MQGRQLASITVDGSTYNYSYDGDGIRTQKVVNGVTHAYVTQNGKVMRETIGTGATAKVLDFIYDNNGKPFVLIYTNGTAEPQRYYYVLNLQGDVVALMTAERNMVAQYAYNAWGELLSVTDEDGEAITSASHIANLNPIRYRGYYYDAETGFYYLRSRYYDPANNRFINADGYASTGQGFVGHNMFAYCNNNPANGFDPTGKVVSQIEFGNEALLYGEYESGWETVHIPTQPLFEGTISIGVSFVVGGGVAVGVSLGVTIDGHLNTGIITSVSAGGGFPVMGANVFLSVTDAPEIEKQGGHGISVGGSIASLGVDYNILIDKPAETAYNGVTISCGIPFATFPTVPVELHGMYSYTWVWDIF